MVLKIDKKYIVGRAIHSLESIEKELPELGPIINELAKLKIKFSNGSEINLEKDNGILEADKLRGINASSN